MHPFFDFELFSRSFDLSAYSVFFYLALFSFLFGSYFFAVKKMNLSGEKVLWGLFIMILGGVIGARILNALLNFNFYLENPSRFWSLKLQGFSIFGSFIAVPLGYLYCKVVNLNFWRLFDALAPFLGISIALMRIGCFLNGCCFGKDTNLPWGVVFPGMGRTHLHQISENPLGILGGVSPVHPTQIYELVAALLGSALAFYLIKKKQKAGLAFLSFAIWFTVFRFFNNFFRVPPETFDAPIWFYSFFYLILFFMGLMLFFKRIKFIRNI